MTTCKCRHCQGSGEQIDSVKTGRDLRRQRKLSAMSLRHVAQRMGVSAAYLSDLELGRRHWREALIAKYNEIITE